MTCTVTISLMRDQRLYVGHAGDPIRRTAEHALGDGARTPRILGFDRIIFTEGFPDLHGALARERQLERWTRAKKLAPASGHLAELKRLSRSRQSRNPKGLP